MLMSNPALRLYLFHFENPGCSLGCFCVKRRWQPVWFLLFMTKTLHCVQLYHVDIPSCCLAVSLCVHVCWFTFCSTLLQKPVGFSVAHFLASPFLCWAHPGHYVNASAAANLHRCKKGVLCSASHLPQAANCLLCKTVSQGRY